MGPIDYLVVEFPGSRMTGEGLPLLVDLVDRRHHPDPGPGVRPQGPGRHRCPGWRSPTWTGTAQLDLAVFEGASSGLLGIDDIEDAGTVLEPGSSAGVLVYENVWAAPFAAALRRGGGQLVASGRIPVQAALAALDAAEVNA